MLAVFAGQWWHMLLILAFRRQRQVNLCELEASLIYRVSSRTARVVIQRNTLPLKKKTKQTTTTKSMLSVYTKD